MNKIHFYTIVVSEYMQENYKNENWNMKKMTATP